MNKSVFAAYLKKGKYQESNNGSEQKDSPLTPTVKKWHVFCHILIVIATVFIFSINKGTAGEETASAWDGNCLVVDGVNDYADLLTEGTVDVATNESENFTVEFWVYPTGYR
ncbi:unnamed protein product, partial [marine sediment metagenome]